MKNYLLIVFFAIISIFPAKAYDGYTCSDGQFTYDIYAYSDFAYLVGYLSTCPDTVVVPEYVTYEGIDYKVTGIGQYSFHSCKNLKKVILPSTISRIERSAFRNCTSLSTVICYAIAPPSLSLPASGECTAIPNYATVYVPRQSLERYKDFWLWGNFYNILAIEDYDLTNISHSEMDECKVRYANGRVTVTGLSNDEDVSVYSLGGALIGRTRAKNGTAYLPVNDVVVIVKVGSKRFKVSCSK